MASVDLVARLVDIAVFRGLCSLPGDQLALALSKGELRDKRPDEIPSLDRAFDIDAEAEFLDWYDEQPVDWTPAGFLQDLAQIPLEDAANGLRLLSDLASPGSFRCWEGRACCTLMCCWVGPSLTLRTCIRIPLGLMQKLRFHPLNQTSMRSPS